MADKKISQLSAATTPLAGTEVLPIVQSGSTVKVSIDNVTKGRTVNATTFDTDVAAAGVTLSGTTLSADGTDANININVTPKGTGSLVTTKLSASGNVDFNGGTFRFNVGKADLDFSVSGDTDDNLIYADASTDRVGIGRNNPAAKLDVEGAAIIRGNVTNTGAFIAGANVSAPSADAFVYRSADNTLALGTANAARITIDSSGNSTLNTGNLIIGTAAKGIDFSANTHAAGMTSELLNWYEEGTWTGTLTATTPPTTPVTATGRYTRVGRQVTVNIEFDNKNTTGASGAMSVTGLPFTAGSAGYGPTMKNSMGVNVITATVSGGGSSISFSDAADMTNFNIVAAAGIYLRLSVTYFV